MKVSLARKGGFAGIEEKIGPIDVDSLESDAREKFQRLVDGARFFDLPAKLAGETIGADLVWAEMTVATEMGSHTVTFAEDEGVPRELTELVRLIEESASTRPR